MNRNEEYAALLHEVSAAPPALEFTLQRAKARQTRRRRWGRGLGIPVGSLAVFFVSFTLLVNLLPTFARACGGIPVLRELAKSVAWSPSLTAAVENDYVQPMDLEQTKDGITARIEYVIVDKRQLHIFYTLQSSLYPRLDADMLEVDGQGEHSASAGSFRLENGALGQFTLDFAHDMPDTLTFTLPVYQWAEEVRNSDEPAAPAQSLEERMLEEDWTSSEEPEILATFSFTLRFDPWFTAQGEVFALNQPIELEGQTVTLADVELYPTHMRLRFSNGAENTAWLKDMAYYLENERGERFEGISNGISATGDLQDYGEKIYHMESSFFSKSEHLTLYIQCAHWLDYDKETIRVDLARGAADWLPKGVTLEKTTQIGAGWVLTLRGPMFQENHLYSLVSGVRTEAGEDVHLSGSSITIDSQPGYFIERIPLQDYPDATVYLEPAFSRYTQYETPVAIPIK